MISEAFRNEVLVSLYRLGRVLIKSTTRSIEKQVTDATTYPAAASYRALVTVIWLL